MLSRGEGEDDDDEKEEDTVDEEEDASAEGSSSSPDGSADKPTEETPSPVSSGGFINVCVFSCRCWRVTADLFQKPEELKEESVPDGEQKGDRRRLLNKQGCDVKTPQSKSILLSTAAEITEQPDEDREKTDDGSKPANGTADGSSKSQSGSSKKVGRAKTGDARSRELVL